MSSPNITPLMSRRDLSRSHVRQRRCLKKPGAPPGIQTPYENKRGRRVSDRRTRKSRVQEMNRALSAGPFARFILGRCPRLILNAAPLALTEVKPLCQMALDYFGLADANFQRRGSGPSTP